MENYYMKSPCKSCPFRKDVRPFLHPDRAYEIAAHASNPYNEFYCHKTTEHDDEFDEMVTVETTKECAGFITIRAGETEEGIPEEFKPAFELCYESLDEMYDAYLKEWNKERGIKLK